MESQGDIDTEPPLFTTMAYSEWIDSFQKIDLDLLRSDFYGHLENNNLKLDKDKDGGEFLVLRKKPFGLKYVFKPRVSPLRIDKKGARGIRLFVYIIPSKADPSAKFYRSDLVEISEDAKKISSVFSGTFDLRIASNKKVTFQGLTYSTKNSLDLSDWKFYYSNSLHEDTFQTLLSSPNYIVSHIIDEFSKETKYRPTFRIISNNLSQHLVDDAINCYDEIGYVNTNTIDSSNFEFEIRPKNPEYASSNYVVMTTSDPLYYSTKEFFIQNGLVSQHLDVRNADRKGTKIVKQEAPFDKKAHFIEIYHKNGFNPIYLPPPSDVIQDLTGFLYLSDIDEFNKGQVDSIKRVYASSFTYGYRVSNFDEKITIIDFDKTRTEEDVSYLTIDEEDYERLAKAIKASFELNDAKIDLVISKSARYGTVVKLVESLSSLGLRVRRVWKFSAGRMKFLDEFLPSMASKENAVIPYHIIDNKVAFFQPSMKLSHFHNLSGTTLQLLWPIEGELTSNDVKKFVWLIKKRVYRPFTVSWLKEPEPIWIIRQNSRVLKNINNLHTIDVRSLV